MTRKQARGFSSASTQPASRPMSSQSTESADSNATQPILNGPRLLPNGSSHYQAWQQGQIPALNHQQQQQQQQHHHHHHQNGSNQFNNNALLAGQSWLSSIQFNQHGMPINTSFTNEDAQMMAAAFGQSNMPVSQHVAMVQARDRMDSPTVSTIEGEAEATTGAEAGDIPKKKGSATSQANEMELQRIFGENKHKSLEEVAVEVKVQVKGPKGEKSKQLFGMLWLSRNIRSSKGSVPRNRVYTAYVKRCNEDTLPVLNPASFGKLVRIIHPNISTRRLGVRGESKYHYCDLSLVGDVRDSNTPDEIETSKEDTTAATTIAKVTKSRPLSIQPRADPPVPHPQPGRPSLARSQGPRKRTSSIFLDDASDDPTRIVPTKRAKLVTRVYAWPDEEHSPMGDCVLPEIAAFLSDKADLDAANNLESIYGNHCRQLVHHFRYCKTEDMISVMKSLCGLLTMPSQKLLNTPRVPAWIEMCDTGAYQAMIRMLESMVLCTIPPEATAHMESVAKNLCAWIKECFSSWPDNQLEAKLRPARYFEKMMSRFFSVNRSARAIYDALGDEEDRDRLWSAWIDGLDAKSIVEEVCDGERGGRHRLLHLLCQDARIVLNPSEAAHRAAAGSLFDEESWAGLETNAAAEFRTAMEESDRVAAKSGETFSIVERILAFTKNLPKRFPHIEAGDMLESLSHVNNRITINLSRNAPDAGCSRWLVVNAFITDAMFWHAETGGFLALESTNCPLLARRLSPYENIQRESAEEAAGNGLLQTPNQGSTLNQKNLGIQENSLASHLDASRRGNQRLRVSLGGETVIGDDDYSALDTGPAFDWANADFKSQAFLPHEIHLGDGSAINGLSPARHIS